MGAPRGCSGDMVILELDAFSARPLPTAVMDEVSEERFCAVGGLPPAEPLPPLDAVEIGAESCVVDFLLKAFPINFPGYHFSFLS